MTKQIKKRLSIEKKKQGLLKKEKKEFKQRNKDTLKNLN